MKNLEKYLSILDGEVDGLLLTSRYSRHYGAEFDIAEGVAIVTKAGCRYFTDSRYIESAQNGIRGFEVIETNRSNSATQLLAKAIADGDEDACMVLLYGSRTLADAVFQEEFKALEGEKFKLVNVLSHEEQEGCENGFITAELIKKYAPEGDYSIFLWHSFREELDEEAGPTAPTEKKYKVERTQKPRESYNKLFEEAQPEENKQNEKLKFNRKTGKFVNVNKGDAGGNRFEKGGKRFDKKPGNDKRFDRKAGGFNKPAGKFNRK